MWKRKVVSFDEFAHVCPYFTGACSVNNGYGCTHPKQEETDFDRELSREHGKCYDFSCPLGITPDADDLDNPEMWIGTASPKRMYPTRTAISLKAII